MVIVVCKKINCKFNKEEYCQKAYAIVISEEGKCMNEKSKEDELNGTELR